MHGHNAANHERQNAFERRVLLYDEQDDFNSRLYPLSIA
jgi:hypothetical protein